jgi:hypothetical protein
MKQQKIKKPDASIMAGERPVFLFYNLLKFNGK